MEINSLSNAKVVFWTKLKQKKYRNEYFIVEGENLVREALKSQYIKEIITTTNEIFSEKVSHYKVTPEIMKKITALDTVPKIIGVCRKLQASSIKGNILILDNIQDPGNLGTLIRSAFAFNFTTIVLGTGCVDLYNPKVIRASEGMIFKINFINKDTKEAIIYLKDKGYTIIGTDVRTGVNIKGINATNKALILGNEGNGLNKDILEMCDYTTKIEINKECESLNVGVAGSILMYEVSHE